MLKTIIYSYLLTIALSSTSYAEESEVFREDIYQGFSSMDPAEDCELKLSMDSKDNIIKAEIYGYGFEWESYRKAVYDVYSLTIAKYPDPIHFDFGMKQVTDFETKRSKTIKGFTQLASKKILAKKDEDMLFIAKGIRVIESISWKYNRKDDSYDTIAKSDGYILFRVGQLSKTEIKCSQMRKI